MKITKITSAQAKKHITPEMIRMADSAALRYDVDSPKLTDRELRQFKRASDDVRPVISLPVDHDIYVGLSKVKNWTPRLNDIMRGWLMSVGAL